MRHMFFLSVTRQGQTPGDGGAQSDRSGEPDGWAAERDRRVVYSATFPWRTETRLRRTRMRLRAAIAALFLIVPAVHATTIVLPSDDQLINKSPLIVTGKVIDSTPVDHNGSIYTVTRVAVEQALKGQAASTIEIREVGGRIGDRFNVVFGSPEYKAGEQVLLFLWPTGRGDYQTRDLFVGKFSQRFTKNGDRLWFRETEANGTHLLDAQLQTIESRNIQRLADKFTHYLAERVAGRMANRDYVIDNPSLERVPE